MGSFQDLTGMKFNRLSVIELSHKDKRGAHYWKCRCDCGNLTVMRSNHLKSGHNKSCGCLHKEVARKSLIDLSGKAYGRLTVLKFDQFNFWGDAVWRCICTCGKESLVKGSSLTSGHTKSCGCYRKEVQLSVMAKPGKKHRNWRGGVYFGYSSEWTDELRESVRNRDGRKCQYPECDYDDTKAGRKRLDVHHIDGNKKNCLPGNLISLCHPHHMKVETQGARKWKFLFWQKIGDYS